jgi:hypothetical protein
MTSRQAFSIVDVACLLGLKKCDLLCVLLIGIENVIRLLVIWKVDGHDLMLLLDNVSQEALLSFFSFPNFYKTNVNLL